MPEHLDVLIVGAGLSGVGAGCRLRRECPGKSFALLEAREAIGGTWDLFRYPGIRSDSDMFTLGYDFKPWEAAKAIADGEDIREYVRQTAREHGVDRAVRFGQKVVGAAWSSADARWTVDVEHRATGERTQLTCGFYFSCTGYYDYEEAFTPAFAGVERFPGPVVHPQFWPEDLDYAGRRVVVIGSGATAVTLVPAMAPQAEHVTMLQRSPSYIVALPARDPIADVLRRRLPAQAAYRLVRAKNVLMTLGSFSLSRKAPGVMRRFFRSQAARHLPPDYEVDTHLNPRYQPWDQRVCLVPDGDLFRSLRHGDATIVTDEIETFTETGLRLASGAELEADVVITATGLNLLPLGGIPLVVDGEPVDVAGRVAYKGMMLDGVPNLALALGYTNASWTLKCDLVSEYVCRLLARMDATGRAVCTPVYPAGEPRPDEPLIDLTSGYVMRSIDRLPRQGPRPPWRLHQNYLRDLKVFRRTPLEDGAMVFSSPAPATRPAAPPASAALGAA